MSSSGQIRHLIIYTALLSKQQIVHQACTFFNVATKTVDYQFDNLIYIENMGNSELEQLSISPKVYADRAQNIAIVFESIYKYIHSKIVGNYCFLVHKPLLLTHYLPRQLQAEGLKVSGDYFPYMNLMNEVNKMFQTHFISASLDQVMIMLNIYQEEKFYSSTIYKEINQITQILRHMSMAGWVFQLTDEPDE